MPDPRVGKGGAQLVRGRVEGGFVGQVQRRPEPGGGIAERRRDRGQAVELKSGPPWPAAGTAQISFRGLSAMLTTVETTLMIKAATRAPMIVSDVNFGGKSPTLKPSLS